MKTLVFAAPGDFHAFAVKWALERLGLRVDVVFLSDVPQQGSFSFRAGADVSYEIRHGKRGYDLLDYDIVWFRRMVGPVPPQGLHESDHRCAVRDWELVRSSLEQAFGSRSSAFCVNPPVSAGARRLKPYQLQIALDCGFTIPPTLISTSPAEINEFIRTNARGGAETIAKPLAAVLWRDASNRDFGFMTELVTEEDVAESDVSSSPVIFQRRLEKDYEVRATVMGETIMAVKLDSQSAPAADLDFRKVRDWRKLGHEPIALPDDLADRVLMFQSRLGIVFSTLDFIVTPAGEWIFLEANEMGNWLWIESCNPDIPLLDCFARFLASRNARFRYEAPPPGGRIHAEEFASGYGSHIRRFIDHQRDAHVEPRSRLVFPD